MSVNPSRCLICKNDGETPLIFPVPLPERGWYTVHTVFLAAICKRFICAQSAIIREDVFFMFPYPFLNYRLPLAERVQDLVSRLTLEEKIGLMLQYQPAVDRLGVKPYKHGTEAAHGIAWLGKATSFPQPVGLACTWNTELLRRIGSAIGDEARVFYRKDPAVNGLTLWAPTVDMERDPRWGRTEEAYGEDPVLTGELAAALTQGIQGEHPFYKKAIATLKHFLGNNNEIDRGSCSASIDPRNMKEYYQAAFKTPFVKGGALSMMTAYNSVNGTPAILLEDVNRVVKGEWGMEGFIVSDAGDLVGLVRDHGYVKTYKEAVALSIRAGIDSITDDKDISTEALRQALEEGLLVEEDLDRALRNTFGVRFRLGEFDPEEDNPYATIPDSVLCCKEHEALSLEAARESVVLLKNVGLLPLRGDALRKVAVIGALGGTVLRDWYSGSLPYQVTPLEGIGRKLKVGKTVYRDGQDRIRFSTAAGAPIGLSEDGGRLKVLPQGAQGELFEHGDWGWNSHTFKASNGKFVNSADDVRIAASSDEAFGWFVKEVLRLLPQGEGRLGLNTWNGRPVAVDREGDLAVAPESCAAGSPELFTMEVAVNGLEEAVKAARDSEVAIVFVGNNPLINGKEEVDRPDITLPEAQQELIRQVAAVNPRTVVVLVGSYPFALSGLEKELPSILYISHAGQELGHAVADVLFGDYNPAGRLNMTWYRSVDQLPELLDYDMIRGNRTYQYFEGDVLYPFGHGLSYTRFAYEELKVSASGGRLQPGEAATVAVRVVNSGPLAGDEVVQLYVRGDSTSRVKRPLKQLKGFRRIHLAPGESRTVTFTLPAEELAFWDVSRSRFCVAAGDYTVMAGASSADIRLQATLRVEGEELPPRRLTEETEAWSYDGYSGVYLDESKEGGSCVRPAGKSGWLRFADAEWNGSSAEAVFEARVAGGLSGGVLEVRTGSPDGPLHGSVLVPVTGGRQAWCTVSCGVQKPVAGGLQEVYLVLSGDISLSRFRFIG